MKVSIASLIPRTLTCLAAALLAACGSTDGSSSSIGMGGAPGSSKSGADSLGSGGSSMSDAGSTAAIAAAEHAAATDPLCTGVAPFYWQIGDANGALGGGSEGSL